MKRTLLYISICVFVLACSSVDEKVVDDRTVFKYNDMSGVNSLDPAAARDFENILAVNQLFNGLVEMNDSLKIKPSIAKSWDISEDGRTYIFHLNSTVTFHDNEYFDGGIGRKVTATDFVFSFNRLLDPSVSSATTLLTHVNRKKSGGFEAINDSTLAIYLDKPFTPFLGILTMKYFSVIPKEVVEPVSYTHLTLPTSP
jgi:oligopeptide transport system substrate-binding protein